MNKVHVFYRCPICGKKFWVKSQHYKVMSKNNYDYKAERYCSYGCAVIALKNEMYIKSSGGFEG